MTGTIYTKELRARAICSAGLPLLGLAMWLVLWQVQNAQLRGYEWPQLTFHPAFQLECFASCALAGLVLGIWQVITETPAGPWAFLRHRPASARMLFAGKLAAALTLYTLIAGLPLLIGTWWAATHLPGPWIWAMAIPPAGDFLQGTLFILAGVVIAARDARWFGSRLLPVGLALLCAATTATPWLWFGATGIAVGWLVLLPAAMSAFATRAVESTQRWPSRLLTALALLPALMAIPAVALVFLADQFSTPYHSTYQAYSLVDGRVYRIASGDFKTVEYEVVDAAGRRFDSAPEQDNFAANSQFGEAALTLNWEQSGFGHGELSYRDVYKYFIPVRTSMGEWWYYVYDWHCFVGYSKRQGEPAIRIGYLGADGLVPDRSQVRPLHLVVQDANYFGDYGSLPNLLVESGRVGSVQFERRAITTVFTVPTGERGQSAAELIPRKPGGPFTAPVAVVATDKAIYLVESPDHVRLRIPNPEGYSVAYVSMSRDAAFYTILYHRSIKLEDVAKPLLLIRVDPSGHELTRMELPALPQASYDPGLVTHAIQGMAIPAPIGCIGIFQTARSNGSELPMAIASVGTGILCAIIAALILRLHAMPLRLRLSWLVIVFLLGIGGLLLMFAVRYWPSRVPCPSCHRKRLVTRDHCEHCAAVFPAPDAGPVGVFDSTGESAHV